MKHFSILVHQWFQNQNSIMQIKICNTDQKTNFQSINVKRIRDDFITSLDILAGWSIVGHAWFVAHWGEEGGWALSPFKEQSWCTCW